MATRTARIDVHLTPADARAALRADVLLGLTSQPKQLPPKYFYDARGSVLFEEITALPEYFPTRTEAALLTAHVDEIARLTGATTLVELGSGSSAKTRLLLDALRRAGTLRRYVPLDVSEAALREASTRSPCGIPALALHGVVGDFTAHLHRLPATRRARDRRLVAFLGGTIGNLGPGSVRCSCAASRRAAAGRAPAAGRGAGHGPEVLVAAYDDAAGRDGGVQPQRAARAQPRAARRPGRRGVRPRRAVGRRAGVDRDAAAGGAVDGGDGARSRARRRVRRGGGDAHRDLGEVPHRRPGGRAGRRRVGAAADVGRPAGAVRVDARRSGVGGRWWPVARADGAQGVVRDAARARRGARSARMARCSARPVDEIAPSRVASFHLVREPAWRAPLALGRLGTDRLRLRGTPGLRFARLLGTGRGATAAAPTSPAARCSPSGTTPRRSPPSRTAGSPAGGAGAGPRGRGVRRPPRPAVRPRPVGRARRAHRPAPAAAARRPDGPVAVLTRATVRPSRWHRFRGSRPPVSEELAAAAGLRAAVAIGEAPIGLQATFSLWADAARRRGLRAQPAHRDVVRRTRDEDWYGEELFARFAPLGSTGTWDGRDPLADADCAVVVAAACSESSVRGAYPPITLPGEEGR